MFIVKVIVYIGLWVYDFSCKWRLYVVIGKKCYLGEDLFFVEKDDNGYNWVICYFVMIFGVNLVW